MASILRIRFTLLSIFCSSPSLLATLPDTLEIPRAVLPATFLIPLPIAPAARLSRLGFFEAPPVDEPPVDEDPPVVVDVLPPDELPVVPVEEDVDEPPVDEPPLSPRSLPLANSDLADPTARCARPDA